MYSQTPTRPLPKPSNCQPIRILPSTASVGKSMPVTDGGSVVEIQPFGGLVITVNVENASSL